MSIVERKRVCQGYEPIEGYVLEKPIGRGGYGEVWRAEAPGGLKKAVKFVYGQQDERRASQELKSLERIKGVQHPFILSLERFELIDNQLVIITELADGSLEDVFKQHRRGGSCGVPREVLLQYLRDAADALDYLHKLYKLQHLDIKPGNLLIVGGRVKVADFGLLKDLGDVECSVVGGLTPIYAPPEVFDGRPSMHSDQYSLAVMYQELLTSTRPFAGRTIAQLATQHVHSAPNLDPLPPADRPIVARALEKSPDRRYESCTEFIERLIRPHRRTATVANEAEVQRKPSATVEVLPQLDGGTVADCDAEQTHILVVGLGGTGWSGLSELRSRIYRFGAASPVSMHSVLIDTDRKVAQVARTVEPTATVSRCRVLETPLRTANEYRDSGTEPLKTISRRWIYNVPRHGQTGGMRPLGRLALVDRGRAVMDVLKSAVTELKQAGTDVSKTKVYLIGSLTGGTGSGMYVDVAYLLRHLLDESAMENVGIVSLLTTARFQGDPSRPLALHSTKAAVRELKHFLKPGNGYPGDVGAGWPSVPAARTPLHDAYLIAQPITPGAPSSLDTAINYIWCDACVCGDWLEKGRTKGPESNVLSIGFRSVGAVEIGETNDWRSSMLASYSTRSLLLQWLGNPSESQAAATEWTARIQRRCRLDNASLKAQVEQWFGQSRQDRRNRLMEHLETLDPAVLKDPVALRARLVRWLSAATDLEQADVAAGYLSEQVEREIRLRLDDRRLDLSGAVTGLERLTAHARMLGKELLRDSDQRFQAVDRTSATETDGGQRRVSDDGSFIHTPLKTLQSACDLGEQVFADVVARIAAAVAMTLEQKLAEMSEAYTDASAWIAQGIQHLSEDGNTIDPWLTVSDQLRQEASKLLDRLHEQYAVGLLFRVIERSDSVAVPAMVSEMTSTATKIIGQMFDALADSESVSPTTSTVTSPLASGPSDSTSVAETHSWTSGGQRTIAMTLESAIDAVRPSLLECGGQQRLFLVCRDRQEKEQLLSRLPDDRRDQITSVLTRSTVPMLIQEAQAIDPKDVIAWLDSLTGDDGRISARLSTRCDVDWI